MYAMCVLKIPITIFIHFEKSGRQFLWAKKETDKHGKCLAKWELVCIPKDQGGLGVLNLRLQNQALLMKNLYKFYNQHDIPWVQLIWRAYQYNNTTPHSGTPRGSFWWRDCLSLMESSKSLLLATLDQENLFPYGLTSGEKMTLLNLPIHTYTLLQRNPIAM
jgi:hypothetical protein